MIVLVYGLLWLLPVLILITTTLLPPACSRKKSTMEQSKSPCPGKPRRRRTLPQSSSTQHSSKPSDAPPSTDGNRKIKNKCKPKTLVLTTKRRDGEDREPSAVRDESAKEEKMHVEHTVIFSLKDKLGPQNDDGSSLDSYEKSTKKLSVLSMKPVDVTQSGSNVVMANASIVANSRPQPPKTPTGMPVQRRTSSSGAEEDKTQPSKTASHKPRKLKPK